MEPLVSEHLTTTTSKTESLTFSIFLTSRERPLDSRVIDRAEIGQQGVVSSHSCTVQGAEISPCEVLNVFSQNRLFK